MTPQEFREAIVDILAFGAENGSSIKLLDYQRKGENEIVVTACTEHNFKLGPAKTFTLIIHPL